MKTKIYVLCEPTGEIRYVGKTSQALKVRLSSHLYKAKSGEKTYKNTWIRSLLKKGLLPTIQQITEVEGDGCKEEIEWIAYFRILGVKLTNDTDGGEGMVNPSLETRKRMSEAHRGQIAWNKGKSPSAEARRNMCKAQKGKKNPNWGKHFSLERRRKISESNKGKYVSLATREKLKKAWKKRKPVSLETRRKESEAHKNPSLETRKKISEARKGHIGYWKGKHRSLETREKMRKAQIGRKRNKNGTFCTINL